MTFLTWIETVICVTYTVSYVDKSVKDESIPKRERGTEGSRKEGKEGHPTPPSTSPPVPSSQDRLP